MRRIPDTLSFRLWNAQTDRTFSIGALSVSSVLLGKSTGRREFTSITTTRRADGTGMRFVPISRLSGFRLSHRLSGSGIKILPLRRCDTRIIATSFGSKNCWNAVAFTRISTHCFLELYRRDFSRNLSSLVAKVLSRILKLASPKSRCATPFSWRSLVLNSLLYGSIECKTNSMAPGVIIPHCCRTASRQPTLTWFI